MFRLGGDARQSRLVAVSSSGTCTAKYRRARESGIVPFDYRKWIEKETGIDIAKARKIANILGNLDKKMPFKEPLDKASGGARLVEVLEWSLLFLTTNCFLM